MGHEMKNKTKNDMIFDVPIVNVEVFLCGNSSSKNFLLFLKSEILVVSNIQRN